MVKAISVLAVVLLMLFGGTVHANPRQTLTDSVELSITTMRPLNPQPGKTLRMSGRLRNTSSDTIASIQVRLLLSTTPMATRSEIATVTAGQLIATDRRRWQSANPSPCCCRGPTRTGRWNYRWTTSR